jgi:hypothetical protein
MSQAVSTFLDEMGISLDELTAREDLVDKLAAYHVLPRIRADAATLLATRRRPARRGSGGGRSGAAPPQPAPAAAGGALEDGAPGMAPLHAFLPLLAAKLAAWGSSVLEAIAAAPAGGAPLRGGAAGGGSPGGSGSRRAGEPGPEGAAAAQAEGPMTSYAVSGDPHYLLRFFRTPESAGGGLAVRDAQGRVARVVTADLDAGRSVVHAVSRVLLSGALGALWDESYPHALRWAGVGPGRLLGGQQAP